MAFDPNPLYYQMLRIYSDTRKKYPKLACEIYNEGSSRSSKTYDAFHFLYTICDHNRNKGLDVYILRNTLKDCREHTFRDFKKCMKIIGADIEYMKENTEPYANLFGNNLFFKGLDKNGQEGFPSDILFFNEMLENANKQFIDDICMRCSKLIIGDWNPKYTEHFVFDYENKEQATFTHSTWRNNKHLDESIRERIKGYYPWLLEDMHLPEEERRPNFDNIKNCTSDRWRALVYGEGIRAARDGVVFPEVNYIDKFPDIPYIHAMDYGYTNDPSVLVKYVETATDIFFEVLMHAPTATAEHIDSYCAKKGIDKNIECVADSADRYAGEEGVIRMNKDLRNLLWNIRPVRKTKQIIYWIESMKNKRINCVVNEFLEQVRKEQSGYQYATVNGISVNKPEDKNNHIWDAVRYGHMTSNQNITVPIIM